MTICIINQYHDCHVTVIVLIVIGSILIIIIKLFVFRSRSAINDHPPAGARTQYSRPPRITIMLCGQASAGSDIISARTATAGPHGFQTLTGAFQKMSCCRAIRARLQDWGPGDFMRRLEAISCIVAESCCGGSGVQYLSYTSIRMVEYYHMSHCLNS